MDTDVTHKILIAEDEDINYFLLVEMLKNYSDLKFDITRALDGQEAVDFCKETNDFDLLFVDIRMPRMNGFEATKIISEIYPSLPIVAQTAYTSQEERHEAVASGCIDYIAKPIDKDMLLDIISLYLIERI
jgi:CheY-like chemotaxis protein